jgi:hypothetical protein
MLTCGSNLNSLDKATPTNFQLIFPKIPTESTISANNPFILNVYSAVIPSVSISEDERRWQGAISKASMNPMIFDSWLVSYVVDGNLSNWKLLFKWMCYIHNNRDKLSELHKNYAMDVALVATSNYRATALELLFIGIWPSNLGEVSFSSREGDVQLESTVTFSYDYFRLRE